MFRDFEFRISESQKFRDLLKLVLGFFRIVNSLTFAIHKSQIPWFFKICSGIFWNYEFGISEFRKSRNFLKLLLGIVNSMIFDIHKSWDFFITCPGIFWDCEFGINESQKFWDFLKLVHGIVNSFNFRE